ncbi:MAG: hypothetical protein ACI9WU_005229, partial [Myxococcota bacterium]
DCLGLLSPCNGYAGWWRFEGRDDVAPDASTLRMHGGAGGAFGPSVAGISGRARDFMYGDVVVVAKHFGLELQDLTFEAVVRHQNNSGGGVVIEKLMDDNPLDRVRLGVGPSGQVWVEQQLGFQAYVDFTGPPVDGGWAAVAMAREGALLSPYTNYVLGQVGLVNDSWIPVGAVRFGEDTPKFHPFRGRLDSIRISNRALSPDQLLHFPAASWAPVQTSQ